MKEYYIYIIASNSWTLYVWMTNNLKRRIYEHKNWIIDGFTKKYSCKKLIYYEIGDDIEYVIKREKQLKKRNREKKEKLIKSFNPTRKDLYDKL